MINTAIKAAKAAGKILKDKYGSIHDNVKSKDDASLVTELDTQCEKRIKEIISENYPDHGFVGEEEGVSNGEADYVWVVDPLDGTHNYVFGLPLFAVCIGLAYKKEFIAGVVYFPALDQLFTAEKGKGSFLNGERLKASDKDLGEGLVSLSSGYFRGNIKNSQRIATQVMEKAFEIRISGCAAYNLISVATKTFVAMLTPCAKIWDVAAGAVIVREAGGIVTDFEGNPVDLDSKNFLAVNKRKTHEELLEILKC